MDAVHNIFKTIILKWLCCNFIYSLRPIIGSTDNNTVVSAITNCLAYFFTICIKIISASVIPSSTRRFIANFKDHIIITFVHGCVFLKKGLSCINIFIWIIIQYMPINDDIHTKFLCSFNTFLNLTIHQ